MPRVDLYHDAVKQGLLAYGYSIADEQVFIKLPEFRLWIDVLAEAKGNGSRILVEVKSYTRIKSPVESFAASLGKCMLYREALDRTGQQALPLYLAVPTDGFRAIFGKALPLSLLQKAHIGLIVYDPKREVIVKWIP
jgi:hypothetical protein